MLTQGCKMVVVRVLALCLVCVSASCGVILPGSEVIETVGYEGARLEVPGASISIPQGALSSNTEVGISRLGDDEAAALPVPVLLDIASQPKRVSPVYRFTPHGTTFAEAVRVVLDTEQRANMVLRLDDEEDSSWEVVSGVDFDEGTASFLTDRFSLYVAYHTDDIAFVCSQRLTATSSFFGVAPAPYREPIPEQYFLAADWANLAQAIWTENLDQLTTETRTPHDSTTIYTKDYVVSEDDEGRNAFSYELRSADWAVFDTGYFEFFMEFPRDAPQGIADGFPDVEIKGSRGQRLRLQYQKIRAGEEGDEFVFKLSLHQGILYPEIVSQTLHYPIPQMFADGPNIRPHSALSVRVDFEADEASATLQFNTTTGNHPPRTASIPLPFDDTTWGPISLEVDSLEWISRGQRVEEYEVAKMLRIESDISFRPREFTILRELPHLLWDLGPVGIPIYFVSPDGRVQEPLKRCLGTNCVERDDSFFHSFIELTRDGDAPLNVYLFRQTWYSGSTEQYSYYGAYSRSDAGRVSDALMVHFTVYDDVSNAFFGKTTCSVYPCHYLFAGGQAYLNGDDGRLVWAPSVDPEVCIEFDQVDPLLDF